MFPVMVATNLNELKNFYTTVFGFNAVKAYAQTLALKLPVEIPLTEESWGQIHFMVKDPAGFKIDVVEHTVAAVK